MTGLAQFRDAVDLPEPGEFADPASRGTGVDTANYADRSGGSGWQVIGWLAGGVAGVLAIAWFIFLGPGEVGSKAQWFFGAVVLVAVLATMWQTISFQRQVHRHAAEAAERLRTELAAAEMRSARQLELMQSLHRAEVDAQRELARTQLDAQRELARAQLDAYRELARAELEAHRESARAELEAQQTSARMERAYLLAQQQKLAMNEVSRAVSVHAQMLATLWDQGASLLRIEDREARERAMNPVFEQIGQVVTDFSVELANAHLLVEDERLHHALCRVNDAVMMAMRVAEDVHLAVAEGRAPDTNPVPSAQRLMHETAAEARHLAWDLLRTGLDEFPTG